MEMFQRSFTADDDIDEAMLLEAANDWEDDPYGDSSAQQHTVVGQHSNKRNIKDFFSR